MTTKVASTKDLPGAAQAAAARQAEEARQTTAVESGAGGLGALRITSTQPGNGEAVTQAVPATSNDRYAALEKQLADAQAKITELAEQAKIRKMGESMKTANAEGPPGEPTQALGIPPQQTQQIDLDTPALEAKYTKNGALDDADYAKIQAANPLATKDVVDDYFAGKQARAYQLERTAYDEFGGKQSFERAAQWAARNMSASEIASINQLLESKVPDKVAAGARLLKSRMEMTVGRQGSRAGGQAGAGANLYQTDLDVRAAMKNRLYNSQSEEGKAYRAEVQRKFQESRNAPQ